MTPPSCPAHAPPHLRGSELGLELKAALSLPTTLTHDGRGRGERRMEEARESLGARDCVSETVGGGSPRD